jgi:hypothetical protein
MNLSVDHQRHPHVDGAGRILVAQDAQQLDGRVLSAEELVRALSPEVLEALTKKLKVNGSSASPLEKKN